MSQDTPPPHPDSPPLGSALAALPIFPLPATVLFPGAILPLHIFEPRYRAMITDVLADKRVLAVARLRPGFEADYEGRPPVFDVAGVGYVVADEELPDERFNIIVRGVGRVRILEELPPTRAYREIRGELLIDSRTSRPTDTLTLQAQLLATCDRLATHLENDGDSLRRLVRSIPAPGGCVDLVSAALVSDPDERQDILEQLDPADRLERLLGHVAVLLSRFAPRGPRN